MDTELDTVIPTPTAEFEESKEETKQVVVEKTPEGDIKQTTKTLVEEVVVQEKDSYLAFCDEQIANLNQSITNNQDNIVHFQSEIAQWEKNKQDASK